VLFAVEFDGRLDAATKIEALERGEAKTNDMLKPPAEMDALESVTAGWHCYWAARALL